MYIARQAITWMKIFRNIIDASSHFFNWINESNKFSEALNPFRGHKGRRLSWNRHTTGHTHSLNHTCIHLNCMRKPEYVEETYTNTGRAHKSHAETPIWRLNSEPSCREATALTTAPPCCLLNIKSNQIHFPNLRASLFKQCFVNLYQENQYFGLGMIIPCNSSFNHTDL